jgi:hypothetical protein
VVDRAPVDPRALQRGDRALLLGQPRAQGEQGVVGGRKLADLLGHLPICVNPAQTGRELCLMDINPTTDRRYDLHRVSLQGSNRAKETGDTEAFGQGYAHPTRDATGSTGWGAVSRTDRLWSGVYPLLSDDVLFPASPLPAVYTRAGGETVPISSGGAKNQSA